MTMPKWNNDWDQSDPLRGKRGWSPRHYFAVGITVILLVIVCGSVVQTVAKVYQKNEIEHKKNELRRDAIDNMASESLRK